MSSIELNYGRGKISFVDDGGRFQVLAPEDETADTPLSDAQVGALIDDPIDSQPLEDIISPGESVLIVVSDATRATASGQVVNLLVRRLVQLGVAPHDLRVIFATGIHRPVTTAEKRELLTPFVLQRIRTLDHNADDATEHVQLGATESGTPIELNRALTEHDHVILTGAINFHYFAGFTGGRKSICPGLASARTVAATHMRALDFETGGRRAGVGTGRLDGNAVHEECERIAAEVAPSFLVNTWTNERGEAVRLYAGDWRVAHRLACAEYADAHALKIAEKRPLVVAACGGWPHDINLIQAHKTLDMAAHACTEGGTIILVAECADGTGRADFLQWFDAANSHALAARLHEAYAVNGQTAWSLLTKAERFNVQLVSRLDADEVRRMRMTPARTIEDALAQAGGDAATTAHGYVMPYGARFIPIVA
ncbi:MAG TPA: nickel-dependent lactate racemase [Pyrinomonadaceae bacterium]|jgi:nickel-dependent lactate racemase|nr:nickel-dependent lactate racemase [Pyrinomonadaceae bacterium]